MSEIIIIFIHDWGVFNKTFLENAEINREKKHFLFYEIFFALKMRNFPEANLLDPMKRIVV